MTISKPTPVPRLPQNSSTWEKLTPTGKFVSFVAILFLASSFEYALIKIAQQPLNQKLDTIITDQQQVLDKLSLTISAVNLATEQQNNQEIVTELVRLREELQKIKTGKFDAVLGIDSDTQASLTTIDTLNTTIDQVLKTIDHTLPAPNPEPNQPTLTLNSSQWHQIDVFEIARASSKIVGQIEYGRDYPYSQQQSGWYQITLDDGARGWVQAQFVSPNE